MTHFPELLRAANLTLDQCNVQPHEQLVIYTDSEREVAVVEAFYAAAVAHGTDPVIVRALSRPAEGGPPAAAVAACKQADLLLDLASNTWSYNPAMREILEGGTRILQCLLPTQSLITRLPDARRSARLDRAMDLIRGGGSIHITDALGTDLHGERGNRRWHPQAGVVTQSGQYDLYGTCMVNCAPIEESVNGVVYLDGPMIMYGNPEYLFVLSQPVKIVVKEGRLTDIDTRPEDGRKIKRWAEQFDDPNVYLISHLGFGLHPQYDLNNFDLAAWESIEGGVLVAFGANDSTALGGSHSAKGHVDAILLHATFEVDRIPLIVEGRPAPSLGS